MTTINVISSSSQKNGYILESGGQALAIELGCQTLDYYKLGEGGLTRYLTGCVSSHKHRDHFNISTVKEILRRGIPVFVGEKVYEDMMIEGSIRGILPLPERQKSFIGGFTVQPFEIAHNVPNYGFLIETPSKERIVFVTDAIECKYRFKDIDCIMVECNHDDETLLENLDKNEVSMSHPEHHMGLEDCIDFCKRNTSISTKQIILIHMSHTNINEDFALKSVQDALPLVKVAVAHSGDTFNVESDNF